MHPAPDPTKTTSVSSAGKTGLAPIMAMLAANAALAFGPWFVRLADTGPVASAFWRISIATPILFAAVLMTGGAARAKTGGHGWLLLASGVAFAADLASWHFGILRTTLANATLFGNSATLFFPIYGFLVMRAWPSRSQSTALLLALVGAALLLGRSAELSSRNLVGDLLCLLAGVLYTVYFAVMARVLADLAALPALAWSSAASALPLLGFAALLGERILPGAWGPVVGLALVSQVVGQSLMIFALGRLKPLIIGIGLLTQPVIAAIIGWTVYGERLGSAELIGAVLVAAALVLVRRER